jgi:ribosomal protein L7/L12
MSFDKKQVVLDKLDKLTKLLEEVNEGDTDNLFHPDWIEVTDTIANINRTGEVKSETLDRMNVIWRKNQLIKKHNAENPGEKLPHEELLRAEVVGMLKVGKKIPAIKFIRENLIGPNGEIMSLVDAKEYVDKIAIGLGL